ncbi:MAG: universal stress protein [Magnetococcales bacterium]|nr:universal stress protein [Magnetococcales bacterium]
MNTLRRIIAVIDLFSPESRVGAIAIATARQHAAELHFVALFDHIIPWQAGDQPPPGSPQERFVLIETQLRERLRHYAAHSGSPDASCTIITGPPGEELCQMAHEWHADLIFADRQTSRTLRNSWVPWLSPITSFPCKIEIVAEERRHRLLHVLDFMRMIKKKRGSGGLPPGC